MKPKELIKVYIDFQNGVTVCICKRNKKLCDKPCVPDEVERDVFRGWKQTMKRDKYGQCYNDDEE